MDLGYKGDKLVTMGVDVASVRSLHVRISEHVNDSERKALFIGEVPSFNELPALMDNYGVHMCAIDHLPERAAGPRVRRAVRGQGVSRELRDGRPEGRVHGR